MKCLTYNTLLSSEFAFTHPTCNILSPFVEYCLSSLRAHYEYGEQKQTNLSTIALFFARLCLKSVPTSYLRLSSSILHIHMSLHSQADTDSLLVCTHMRHCVLAIHTYADTLTKLHATHAHVALPLVHMHTPTQFHACTDVHVYTHACTYAKAHTCICTRTQLCKPIGNCCG